MGAEPEIRSKLVDLCWVLGLGLEQALVVGQGLMLKGLEAAPGL